MPLFTRIFTRPQRQRTWIILTGFYPRKVLHKANWSIFTWAKHILKPASFLKQRIFSKNLWGPKTANTGIRIWRKLVWPPQLTYRTNPPKPKPCGHRSKQIRRSCPSPWQRLTAVWGCWRINRWPRAKLRLICCGSRVICRRFKPLIISYVFMPKTVS